MGKSRARRDIECSKFGEEKQRWQKNNVATAKAQEGAIYGQTQATKTMVEAHIKKVVLLKEHNLLMLMTMSDDPTAAAKARKYLALRWLKELKKLQKRMMEDEAKEAELAKEQE